jgi:hypothetical protein
MRDALLEIRTLERIAARITYILLQYIFIYIYVSHER